jgi:hypothetical protein
MSQLTEELHNKVLVPRVHEGNGGTHPASARAQGGPWPGHHYPPPIRCGLCSTSSATTTRPSRKGNGIEIVEAKLKLLASIRQQLAHLHRRGHQRTCRQLCQRFVEAAL